MEDFKNQTSCSRLLAAPKGPTIWSLRGGGCFFSQQEFFSSPTACKKCFDTKHCSPVAAGLFFLRELGLLEFFSRKNHAQ